MDENFIQLRIYKDNEIVPPGSKAYYERKVAEGKKQNECAQCSQMQAIDKSGGRCE